VLILMDEPAFPGCLIPARLIGVIEAGQTERDGRTTRNDRLIAVATDSHVHRDLQSIKDLADSLVDEIEHFFVSYNQVRGKRFKPRGRFGPKRAEKLAKDGIK
jgi:inorganic pyrophosphatase